MNGVDRLEGLDRERFLADYWQQHPCLISGWLKPRPVNLEGLLDLANDHELPARLICGRQEQANWTLTHGPLSYDDLPHGRDDWTVLIQEVDKACPEVAGLLENFRFLPDWMIDDIMISQAADGGSVGAHVDAYDVFLVQAAGRRRWQLAVDFDPRTDQRFEQALLQSWSPQTEILVEAGSALYLPPGIAHHGVADGSCQTWSVGLRTPSGPEMLFSLAEHCANHLDNPGRLRLPNPDPSQPALINADLLTQARRLMADCLALDDDELAGLLAGFLSSWRLWPDDGDELEIDDVLSRLVNKQGVALASSARLALTRRSGAARLHVNGELIECPEPLALDLAASRRLDAAWEHAPDAVGQLLELGALAPSRST